MAVVKKEAALPLLIIACLDLLLLWGIDQNYFFRQLIFWLFGFSLFFSILKIRFSLASLSRFNKIYFFLVLALLTAPLLGGKTVRGSVRWIFVNNQSFQPSELAKPLFIFFLASTLSRIFQGSWREFFLTLFPLVLPIILLIFQPNLGTALVFCFSVGVLFFFSRFNKRMLLAFLLFFLPLVFWGGRFLLADYQKARIQVFLNPWLDPLGKGYNSLQSEVAFGSGKFFGRGLALGGQTRLFFLPERHTDFIFASLGESFGFVGVTLFLLLYCYLFLFCWRQVVSEETEFTFLLKAGLLSYLWFQMVINMGMNLGLLPISGLPLPLFSYGGSSLLTSLISLGLILKKD